VATDFGARMAGLLLLLFHEASAGRREQSHGGGDRGRGRRSRTADGDPMGADRHATLLVDLLAIRDWRVDHLSGPQTEVPQGPEPSRAWQARWLAIVHLEGGLVGGPFEVSRPF